MTELRHERGPGRGPGEGRWSCGSWAGRRYRRMAMPDMLDLEGHMGRSDRPRRLPMGQWRGTYLDTGPPRGPGHYSQDGSWWWDDDQGFYTPSTTPLS